MLGVPIFVVGAIALGFTLVRYVPPAAQSAALPIILAATGLGLFLSTIWAVWAGQSFVASVFGIFMGFWWSYPLLLLGLGHNWYGIPAADVTDSVALFLISWAVIIFFLMIASMRLPFAFTVLLALVVLALVLVTIGALQGSDGVIKAGGVVVFLFAAVGIYLFMSAALLSLGGRGLPLGKPMIKAPAIEAPA